MLRNQSDENEQYMNSDVSVPSVLKLEGLTAAYSGKIIMCRKIDDNYIFDWKMISSKGFTAIFITQGLDTQPRICVRHTRKL